MLGALVLFAVVGFVVLSAGGGVLRFGSGDTVQPVTDAGARKPATEASVTGVAADDDLLDIDWTAVDAQHQSGWWHRTTRCCSALRRLTASAAVLHPLAGVLASYVMDPDVATVVESGARSGWTTAAMAVQPSVSAASGSLRRRRYRSIAPALPQLSAAVLGCAEVCFGGGPVAPTPVSAKKPAVNDAAKGFKKPADDGVVVEGKVLTVDLPYAAENARGNARPIDVYITDTLHNGDHTVLELVRVAPLVSRTIVIVGATKYAQLDESASIAAVGWSKFARSESNGVDPGAARRPEGLRDAVGVFLNSSIGSAWRLGAYYAPGDGAFVLHRVTSSGAVVSDGLGPPAQLEPAGLLPAAASVTRRDISVGDACRAALFEVLAHGVKKFGGVVPRQFCVDGPDLNPTVTRYYDLVLSAMRPNPKPASAIAVAAWLPLLAALVSSTAAPNGALAVVYLGGCHISVAIAIRKALSDHHGRSTFDVVSSESDDPVCRTRSDLDIRSTTVLDWVVRARPHSDEASVVVAYAPQLCRQPAAVRDRVHRALAESSRSTLILYATNALDAQERSSCLEPFMSGGSSPRLSTQTVVSGVGALVSVPWPL
jgi:hypothetical protein